MAQPKDEKDQVSKELEKKDTSWLGSAIGALPSVIDQFNYKKQGTDLEIARYNSEAATAASKNSPEAMNKNMMWAGVALVVVILVFLFAKKQ